MSVESFDPGALDPPLDGDVVAALCKLVPDGDELELEPADVRRFAAASKHAGWAEQAKALADEDIRGLIRLFTLGEAQHAEWNAGAKSPVIALVRELKSRGAYDAELTRWIKAHTTNRFLPHGSLLDRL